MASETRIRPASKADRPRLAEIFLVARRHTFSWMPADRFKLNDFNRETEGETILAAEHAGQIVGFAAFWEPDAFLHHLYVEPAFQRRGIGRALIQRARDVCVKPLELKCQTANRPAMAFYERLGFVRGDTGISDIGPWVRYKAPVGS